MHDPLKEGALKKVDAHQFERQAEEWYLEPVWTTEALLKVEPFFGAIHDPCCGVGRIPCTARRAGHIATGGDIVDRGFPGFILSNFLTSQVRRENIVMNPPFDLIREFIATACHLTDGKVASICPARRLPAAGAWLRQLPLLQVWYLTPRPSMPPGHVVMKMAAMGKEPSGGKEDFVWLVFSKEARLGVAPRVSWLHRDKGRL